MSDLAPRDSMLKEEASTRLEAQETGSRQRLKREAQETGSRERRPRMERGSGAGGTAPLEAPGRPGLRSGCGGAP